MANKNKGKRVSKVTNSRINTSQKREGHISVVDLAKLGNLSEREFQIMQLIYAEYTNKQIADKLFISITTVISHRKHLYKKLEVTSTVALIKYMCHTGAHSLEYTDLHPK